MPSIEQSLTSNLNLEGYTPVAPSTPQLTDSSIFTQEATRRSSFLRCPVPPQGSTDPDNLRQFYLNSVVPQYRIFSKV